MDEESYRTRIERLIKEMTGEQVLNGSPSHASIIIERMFANARSEMRIFSRRFDPRIYGGSETAEEAELFLGEPDRSAKILVESFDKGYLKNHNFVEMAKDYPNAEFRVLHKDIAPAVKFNFAVMDDAGYRFEEDKRYPVAIAAFGDKKFAGTLRGLFDDLWEVSEPIADLDKSAPLFDEKRAAQA